MGLELRWTRSVRADREDPDAGLMHLDTIMQVPGAPEDFSAEEWHDGLT